MAAVLMAELALEAGIPPGVFNVVQGVGEAVGAALVEHPRGRHDLVHRLGGDGQRDPGGGRQARQARGARARRQERRSSSSPTPTSTPRWRRARCGVWGASGQVCTAGTRVLLHRDIHDEVVERIVGALARHAARLRVRPGDADGPGRLGRAARAHPALRRDRPRRGRRARRSAASATATVRGYFHEPTVFTGVRNDMRIAQEEIFGPVMSVLPFSSEEEAYRIANDTEYGLAAGVWTSDLARAHRAGRALRAGTVWVNTYQMVYPSVPYGGFKLSGHGKALGRASIEELTQIKSVWMKVRVGTAGHPSLAARPLRRAVVVNAPQSIPT